MTELSTTHKRVLISVLKLIEKSIWELKNIIKDANTFKTMSYSADIDKTERDKLLLRLTEIEELIERLFIKYRLKKNAYKLSAVISSKMTNYWLMVNDLNIKSMERYGKMQEGMTEDYRRDIDELLKLLTQNSDDLKR